MATSTLSWFSGGQKTRPGVLYPHAQWWFALCLVMTWLGFSRSYFAVITSEPLLHHIHGALMGGWIVTLILQPILYQQNRIRLHRTIGKWAVCLLIPAIAVCGFLMVRNMFRTTHIPPFIVNHLAFLDACSLIQLPVFVALAVIYARNLNIHARCIAYTVLMLMPPALARATQLPGWHVPFALHVNFAMGLMSLVLLVLIADDWRKGKIYWVYPVGFVLNTVAAIAANYANGWAWWHAVATWIKG
ncbi:MAG: hypothetical protein V4734_05525 [Terriglobus sp.]